jgi:hypothetical protein
MITGTLVPNVAPATIVPAELNVVGVLAPEPTLEGDAASEHEPAVTPVDEKVIVDVAPPATVVGLAETVAAGVGAVTTTLPVVPQVAVPPTALVTVITTECEPLASPATLIGELAALIGLPPSTL